MTARQRRAKTTKQTSTHKAIKPNLPTTIITSFKGGVGKTALAVTSAERLCLAGVNTLLLSTDAQMDAAKRLGTKPAPGRPVSIIKDEKHGGILDLLCIPMNQLIDVLYRKPEFTDHYEALIIDTAPEARLGGLDFVHYWIPIDGRDAGENAAVLLQHRQPTSTVVLIPMRRAQPKEIKNLARHLGTMYSDETISDCAKIASAHNKGTSIWSLSPRRGSICTHLDAANEIAFELWQDVKGKKKPFPEPPKASEMFEYTPMGWG